MSFFLVYLAIVLIGAILWAGAGGRRGILRAVRRGQELLRTRRTGYERQEDAPEGASQDGFPRTGSPPNGLLYAGFGQPPANLPPVLLPAEAAPADIDRLRFSLGLRGYRMDQVDQVLDELRDQIAAKDEEMVRLRAQLLAAERAAPSEAAP